MGKIGWIIVWVKAKMNRENRRMIESRRVLYLARLAEKKARRIHRRRRRNLRITERTSVYR